MELNKEQYERYSRHLILPEVGEEGQKKLLGAKVFVLGAGGLGSPSLYYLAAAGVGTIGLADGDVVDLSNLQRQIIHNNKRVGVKKTISAKETINDLNPDIKVITYDERVTAENVRDIIKDYDVVLDGSDNFPTRFLMNDACFFEKKPLVSGSMFRFDGQVSVFNYNDDAPCYRCLYAEPPPPGLAPSCNEAGILGALAGVIGVMQCVEAIKIILNIGRPLDGKLMVFDALDMGFRKMSVNKDPECALCSAMATIKEVKMYEEVCDVATGNTVSGGPAKVGFPHITSVELSARIGSGDCPILLDVREGFELKAELGCLDDIVHIPLGSVEARLHELDELLEELDFGKDAEITVICKAGMRAISAAEILKKNEFTNLNILTGGMLAWRKDVG